MSKQLKLRKIYRVLLCIFFLFSISCNNKSRDPELERDMNNEAMDNEITKEDVREEVREAKDAVTDYIIKEKREQMTKIDNKIDELDREITEFKKGLNDDLQKDDVEIQKKIDRREERKRALREKREKIEASTEENWEEFKRELQDMFEDVDK